MAQLIKLADYVSRYEIDIYRYPARYVRLKKERWQRLKQDWEARKNSDSLWDDRDEKAESFITKSIGRFRKRKESVSKEEPGSSDNKYLFKHSLEDLKEAFREELFQFQMNWASSTVSEISAVKKGYYYDRFLRMLVQQLPDTFFIMYEPVFVLKKAPVDMDIIIITPTEIWLIKPLRGDDRTIFQADNDRFWQRNRDDSHERILHPVIALRRMKTVTETLLKDKGLDMPVKVAVVAPESYIDIPSASTKLKLVDKRNIKEFKQLLLKNQTPVKHNQLKVADTLLIQSMTVSRNRMESGDPDREFDPDSSVEND